MKRALVGWGKGRDGVREGGCLWGEGVKDTVTAEAEEGVLSVCTRSRNANESQTVHCNSGASFCFGRARSKLFKHVQHTLSVAEAHLFSGLHALSGLHGVLRSTCLPRHSSRRAWSLSRGGLDCFCALRCVSVLSCAIMMPG
eukprot:3102379-Rhodomonas_salina.2